MQYHGDRRSDPVILTTERNKINSCDGNWHTLYITVKKESLSLQVDEEISHNVAVSAAPVDMLNSLPLYIGGVPGSALTKHVIL